VLIIAVVTCNGETIVKIGRQKLKTLQKISGPVFGETQGSGSNILQK